MWMDDLLRTSVRQSLSELGISDFRLLIGVSGGADSVSLLRAMLELAEELKLTLAVAHFDHAMRPDSAENAAWVQQLATLFGLPCYLGVRSGPISAAVSEETARQLRYRFLLKTAQEHQFPFIAVAHTADDQVETVLHHLLRGTGLKGLSGIPLSRKLSDDQTLIRPLLQTSRKDVLQALESWQQPYLTDSTNTDERLTRNRIRLDLIPQLKEKFNPQVSDALIRLAKQAAETQELIEHLASDLLSQATLEQGPTAVVLNRKVLKESRPPVLREAFRQVWERAGWPRQNLSAARLETLCQMVRTGSPRRCSLPGNVLVTCRKLVLEFHRQVGFPEHSG